ncbi:MAG TPA: carboxypeptidase-like regulatory domain-containing protein [Terriglobales bacterium]|nr:carboxypeptidase-like regulatory domain-containing protein [Terriglobales bacterium]
MQLKGTLLAAVFCALVSVSSLSFGQASGSFTGTVTDKSGSVITGAKVTATSQATGISREAVTDDTGHYLIPLLSVSTYTVKVESGGFAAVEQKDIRLQVDEHREINFTMVPASVSEKVEVSATEVAVQTANPTLGQVITSQQVADLPLNGRDFVQLATLTPGTTQETNPNSFFNGGPSSEVSTRGSYSLSVGGSRAQSTDWLLDGNDNNELTAGGISILPSIDAIQEFKVLTFNYSAEYGTRAGPTVLVTTKSGSNQFHGSLFEFFRNTKLDARSYFASEKEKFNLNQFGGALGGPILKDKTFFFLDYEAKRQRRGIPFNGFVPTVAQRNGDFSGFAQLYNPYSVDVPGVGRTPFQCDSAGNPLPVAADGTQAIGTTCNIIPPALINPITQQMINLFPLPNANTAGFNFSTVQPRKLDEGKFDIRLDHNFSAKDSAFARFSYDQATNFVPGGSPGFAEANAFGSTQNITNHGRNVSLSETHIFNDRMINQFSFGFNRIFNHILSFGDRTCEAAKLGIPNANLDSSCSGFPGGAPTGLSQSTTDCVSCGLTSTILGGPYWALGDRGFAPFQGGTNVFTIADSFDIIHGKHNIRLGMQFRANQMNVLTNAFQDGFLVFTNLWTGSASTAPNAVQGGDNAADFLLGLNSLAIHDQTFRGATTGRRWKLYRPYVQDDWRVTNNLTLNLGLAWALVTPITEAHNRQANFDFPTGQYLIPGVNSDSNVGIQFDKTALEPRIGLAWKPWGSTKTAFRAGYSIFHDSAWNQGAQGLWENPPFFAETGSFAFTFGGCASPTAACAPFVGPFDFALNVSNGFPLLTTPPDPATFQGTIQSQNRNFKQGRVQQFNFNIERELPGQVVLTVGYAGSRSHHILVDGSNLNVSSPTACGVVPGYTLGCGVPTAPYGPFTTISATADAGNARYDSLQAKAETKSARHGLYALLSYTYARNFDSGFNDGLGTSAGVTYWPLPGASRADWGLSQIQLNHNFTASVLYDLPFGRGKRFGGNWTGAANAIAGNWQINVIEKITSGFPVFLINSTNGSGVNLTNNGNNLNRPDQVCSAEASNPTLNKWFNTQCFVNAPNGELGNAARAPVYGPDFVNTDFSLIKHFVLPFREGMGLDFRAEFFNLFNHAQFGLPGNDVSSGTQFGVISSTVNNPRLIQFALKLQF